MSTAAIYALLSVVAVSLISLIGIFTVAVNKRFLSGILRFLVSFAAGALLGDAFIHLLPEAAEHDGFTLEISLSVLAGLLVFFILEKFVRWRHCHISDSEGSSGQHHHTHPFAIMNLVGDALHNFIDGLVIAASYIVSIPVGIATTIAVALHEIPQEIGDYGVLVHGGFSRGKALLINFITALTALLGAGIALSIGFADEELMVYLVAFTAGGFIYIASADLIPEIHKETRPSRSLFELIAFVLGIAIMVVLLGAEVA